MTPNINDIVTNIADMVPDMTDMLADITNMIADCTDIATGIAHAMIRRRQRPPLSAAMMGHSCPNGRVQPALSARDHINIMWP